MTENNQVKEIRDYICSIAHYDFCKDTSCTVCPAKDFADHMYADGWTRAKQGEWIEHIEKPTWLEDDVEVYYECSNCGIKNFGETNYCPCCGANMQED